MIIVLYSIAILADAVATALLIQRLILSVLPDALETTDQTSARLARVDAKSASLAEIACEDALRHTCRLIKAQKQEQKQEQEQVA